MKTGDTYKIRVNRCPQCVRALAPRAHALSNSHSVKYSSAGLKTLLSTKIRFDKQELPKENTAAYLLSDVEIAKNNW